MYKFYSEFFCEGNMVNVALLLCFPCREWSWMRFRQIVHCLFCIQCVYIENICICTFFWSRGLIVVTFCFRAWDLCSNLTKVDCPISYRHLWKVPETHTTGWPNWVDGTISLMLDQKFECTNLVHTVDHARCALSHKP